MTDRLLTCEVEKLKEMNSYWTAHEIAQQPRIWQEAFEAIDKNRGTIDAWLNPLLAKSDLRIILSGAGSSSFVGETVAPWLRQKLSRRFDVLSTTDIVGSPGQSFAEDVPTLMISFARSGDSPESIASVNLASDLLPDCHHLVLTCNPEGCLAKASAEDNELLCLIMPDKSNDRGFAMTSSFTSMLVSCAAIFVRDDAQLNTAVEITARLIDEQAKSARVLADRKPGRLVVLGSGCLFGVAREAALKHLELSAGRVASFFDTPLGFRHGPKSLVDPQTLIIHLRSANPYSARYDQGLLDELLGDYSASQVVSLSPQHLNFADGALNEFWVALPYLAYCQMIAYYTALTHGVSADNPCPTGEVNRVVQGVEIFEYRPDRSENPADKNARD